MPQGHARPARHALEPDLFEAESWQGVFLIRRDCFAFQPFSCYRSGAPEVPKSNCRSILQESPDTRRTSHFPAGTGN